MGSERDSGSMGDEHTGRLLEEFRKVDQHMTGGQTTWKEAERQREEETPQLVKDLTVGDLDLLDFAREDTALEEREGKTLTESDERFLEAMGDEGRLRLAYVAQRWKKQTSKALYIYRGVKYCVTHKSVWFPILTYLVINLLLTAAIFLFLGIFTGTLQYHVVQKTLDATDGEIEDTQDGIDDVDEWLALFYTLYLLYMETKIITRIVGGIFLDRAKREIFDIVFSTERPILLDEKSDMPIRRLSTAPTKERLRITALTIGVMLLMELVTAPFLLIPFFGQVLAVLLMSWVNAWLLLTAFFSRQGLGLKWQFKLLYMRYAEFMAFGVPVTILQHIPIISSLFVFIDVTGAALWAVDMASLSNAFRYIKLNADEHAAMKKLEEGHSVGGEDEGELRPSNSLGMIDADMDDDAVEFADDDSYDFV